MCPPLPSVFDFNKSEEKSMKLSLGKLRIVLGGGENMEAVVTPDDKMPPAAETKTLSFQESKWDKLLLYTIGSIVAVFCLTRLDAFTSSQTVGNAIRWCLDTLCLYTPFFPGRMWAGTSCMWIHSTSWHLLNNMLAMLMLGLWLNKAYGKRWWVMFFLVGGTIGNIIHVLLVPVPPFDWANWHGSSIASLIHEPNTPLGGASGGVFAMWGAATAAGFRYWLNRKKGVKNPMGVGALELLLFALGQFIFIDAFSSSIAGVAHQGGMVAGFLLGMFPALRGRQKLLTNTSAVDTRSFTFKLFRKKLTPVSITIFFKPEFNGKKETVFLSQEWLNWRGEISTEAIWLHGAYPDVGQYNLLADSYHVPGFSVVETDAASTDAPSSGEPKAAPGTSTSGDQAVGAPPAADSSSK